MSENHVIQSVQRAIDIINCFTAADRSLSLNQISEKLKLNINTTRGLVQTLVQNEVLLFNRNQRQYSLGYFFNLKAKLVSANIAAIIDICAPYVHKITQDAKVPCSLQLVQGDLIRQVYSDAPEGTRYQIVFNQYLPLPLLSSASGKLLLAYKIDFSGKQNTNSLRKDFKLFLPEDGADSIIADLRQIRKDGYSVEDNEYESLIYSIAVPICIANEMIGSLSISGLASELKPREKELLLHLRFAQKEIEMQMH